ncbi:hypothetical protein BH11BAC5_BH11BAC5_49940 [soil metagenome]
MYKKQFKTYQLFFLLAIVAPALCNAQNNKKETVNINLLVDSLTTVLNDNYVFPEKAKSITTNLAFQLKQNAYSNELKNPQKLAEQLQKDISKMHHDPHMRINYDPGFHVQQYLAPTKEEINLTKKYWKENNYAFTKVEILPGNIGYIPFNVFVDDIESAKPTIAAALRFLSNTAAIIIDLRENYGGSPGMVSQIESFFFKEKTHMNDLINRSAKDTTFFYADPAKADSLNLSMPVYILTSHNTFSGGEDFSYGMQKANRAIIVGETTGGGAHPQMPFSVGQGFVISIPYARSLNPVTKTDWEGTGVIPDVNEKAQHALLTAQELIFKNQMLTAKDEKEKHKSEFYLNTLLYKSESKNPPLKVLSQLIGTYPDVTIYIEKGKLLCRNNDDHTIAELKQITNNRFKIDNNAHIEFFKNDSGQFSSIKIYLSDGNVFEEAKK